MTDIYSSTRDTFNKGDMAKNVNHCSSLVVPLIWNNSVENVEHDLN